MGEEGYCWLHVKTRPWKKWRRFSTTLAIVFLLMCILRIQILSGGLYYAVETAENTSITVDEVLEEAAQNWRGLQQRDIQNMSALGRRLFLGDMSSVPQYDRNFTILVWKHGPNIEKRLIMRFGSQRWDPFQDCSVSNCRLTYDSNELNIADAVLFHLHRTRNPQSLPHPETPRPVQQRWVFLTDENPFHTFTLSGSNTQMKDYNGVFNWSMTYRMDSDVPVPSGRVLPLTKAEKLWQKKQGRMGEEKEKTKFAAILISNCGGKNKRLQYLKLLMEHMPVDVYGKCGKLRCEGHFANDCSLLNDYKFYLAFENGDCREYITEKVWWNAYHKGAIPVIMGASLQDCARLLPPKSFIHVRNFSSPVSLAKYLLYVNSSATEYDSFLQWKRNYKVVNEHGYFQSPVYHYCRLCEALNYNDPGRKVYDKLEDFWDKRKDCYDPVF